VAALDRVVHHRVRGADHFSATSFSPNGINWGHYSEPRVQDLLNQAQESVVYHCCPVKPGSPARNGMILNGVSSI
jgi:hypothetical protein